MSDNHISSPQTCSCNNKAALPLFFFAFFLSRWHFLTAQGWRLIVRYCSEKWNKLLLNSVESNIKYFLILTYNLLLHMQNSYEYMIYSDLALYIGKKYVLKISSLFCDPVSYWIQYMYLSYSRPSIWIMNMEQLEIILAAIFSTGLWNCLGGKQTAQTAIFIQAT